MSYKPKLINNITVHFILWMLYILYETSILFFTSTPRLNYLETGLNFVLYAFLFYSNSELLLPKLLRHGHYFAYLFGLGLLLLTYSLLRYGLNIYLLPGLNEPMLHAPSTSTQFWAQTQWRGGYFLMLSFAYWFARTSIQVEQRRREQAQQLQLAERSLSEAEISFLKSQINPHFLFNALNFLYAQVYPKSEEAAKGILLLSDIMRYALKSPSINGKVMLQDELHHLHNYIELNQLRFSHNLQIAFTCTGSPQYLMIVPLVLITFVENCMKHGELLDKQHILRIDLRIVANHLHFTTWNKKRDGPKEKASGIGLANIRKRLDLHYPGQYMLDITDGADFYACSLALDL